MGRKQVTVFDALDALILDMGLISEIYGNGDLSNYRDTISHSNFNRIMMEREITLNQRKMGEFYSLIQDLGIFKKINKSDSCYIIYPKLQKLMKKYKGIANGSELSQDEFKKSLPAPINQEVFP